MYIESYFLKIVGIVKYKRCYKSPICPPFEVQSHSSDINEHNFLGEADLVLSQSGFSCKINHSDLINGRLCSLFSDHPIDLFGSLLGSMMTNMTVLAIKEVSMQPRQSIVIKFIPFHSIRWLR